MKNEWIPLIGFLMIVSTIGLWGVYKNKDKHTAIKKEVVIEYKDKAHSYS
jgi:hypothetical protein